MRHTFAFRLLGSAAAALTLYGCGDAPTENKANTAKEKKGPSPTDILRQETQRAENRLFELKHKVEALDDTTTAQKAAKDELLRLVGLATVERARKNPLDGTIPAKALEDMTRAMDDAEKKLASFPKTKEGL